MRRILILVAVIVKHNSENLLSLQNLLHCSWSPDGAMVSAGSADRFVYIWDTATRRILYKLPGHLGSVNDVDFHKQEPIGKNLIIYSNWNHRDLVQCKTLHSNVT